MNSKPTLLGHVGAVTGAAISVRQSPSVASGIAIIGGKSYRIGQVGSFVRIPQGFTICTASLRRLARTLHQRQRASPMIGEIVG